jgi:hypothetical protein
MKGGICLWIQEFSNSQIVKVQTYLIAYKLMRKTLIQLKTKIMDFKIIENRTIITKID